jgi:protein-S-isoprenylcysteine O-methyltransferase Ste14
VITSSWQFWAVLAAIFAAATAILAKLGVSDINSNLRHGYCWECFDYDIVCKYLGRERNVNDRANVKILPPAIPAIAMSIGGIIHAMNPVEVSESGGLMPLGVVFVLTSIILVLAAVREIFLARTAFDVRKPSTSLVTTGVFRFSRNPTYLSMMFLCFGIALIVNSLPLFLASVLVGSGLCLFLISTEESYIRDNFWND